MKLTTYYHLVLRLRTSGILPPLPHTLSLCALRLLPPSSALNMDKADSSDMLTPVTIHHISDLKVNTHHHENRKSH